MRKPVVIALVGLAAVAGLLLSNRGRTIVERVVPGAAVVVDHDLDLIAKPKTAADKIVNGAKQQARDMVVYDAAYVQLAYPGGDVPSNRGACTDVIIRALRNAGFDLQKLIHEDMSSNFGLYPRKWGLSHPDANIDHRRVPNHLTFMSRFGKSLPKETTGDALKTYKPGDLVYWDYGRGLTHCGVVSNVVGQRGVPLIIHNNGPWASQDDVLDKWPVLGHYRYPKGA